VSEVECTVRTKLVIGMKIIFDMTDVHLYWDLLHFLGTRYGHYGEYLTR